MVTRIWKNYSLKGSGEIIKSVFWIGVKAIWQMVVSISAQHLVRARQL